MYKYCGECKDFLYEDISGYGICMKDNDLHSVRENCIYGYVQNVQKVPPSGGND